MSRSFLKQFPAAIFGFALLPFFISCAGLKKKTTENTSPRENEAVAKTLEEANKQTAATKTKDDGSSYTKSARDIENLTIGEVIQIEEPNTANLYDNSRYDFPITMNSRVEGWIDYFTGRGRPHMERYLGRSSRYIPRMKQIFKDSGLPEDLVYLALIESGFNLRAKSHARAVGPWQFMKATGKRYGLRVDAWVDERRDPLRSTQAAANYLKDLYLMFESWYLAASAYNAGEYKILRAIDELKTNNYWRIVDTKMLRRETKDYIPKLIAAAIIAKNPDKYGFGDVAYMDPLEFDTVKVDFPIHLREIAKVVDSSEEDIQDLNPELARHMVPPNATSWELKIPSGTKTVVEGAFGTIRRGVAKSDIPKEHKVRVGDTLKSIANKFRVRLKELANANNLGPKEKLSPGTSVIIPNGTEAREDRPTKTAKRSVSSTAPSANEAGFVTHTVRRGDSLWSISEQYNVTVQDIFRWNGLKKSQIFPGSRIKVKASQG